MRVILSGIVTLLSAIASLTAGSDNVKETGAPYIRNFTAEEYGAKSQNWAIVQDQRGVTYFGNSNGVLEFDGSTWTLIRLPNNSIVRSLTIDDRGRVYVGGFGEFGFLAVDAQGKTVYVSLLPKLKKTDQVFNDVWKTYALSQGVYFLTLKKMFRLQNDRMEVIPVDLVRHVGFAIGDELFIAQSKGLFLVRNGLLQALPLTERFTIPKSGFVYMLPYRERQPFMIDGTGHFYLYDLNAFYDPNRQQYDFSRKPKPDSILKSFPTEVSAYISMTGNNMYNAISIPGNRYALSTLKGGILIIDDKGKLEGVINKNRGLKDNSVINLCLDREQNLWAALNTGIAYIAISSPLSHFEETTGLEGAMLSVMRFQGKIFVSSFNGISVLDDYRLQLKSDNLHFTQIAPEVREGWDFLPLGDHLLAAAAPRFLLIDPQLHHQAYGNDTFYAIGRSPKFPDTIFVGLSSGLGVFTVRHSVDGKIRLTFRNDVFKEIIDSVRRIVDDGKGNLWLTSRYNGLIHIRFRSRSIGDFDVTRYGVREGLPGIDWNFVDFIDSRLLVSTPKGIYEGIPASPDPPQTPPTRFQPEMTFGKPTHEPPDTVRRIQKDDQKRWWVDANRGIYIASLSAEGRYNIHRECFAPIPAREWHSYLDHSGIFWIPTTKGLYRFDPTVVKNYDTPYTAMIRRVTVGKDKILFFGNHYDPLSRQDKHFTRYTMTQSSGQLPRLPYQENSLTFHFSALYFEHDSAMRFQYMLEGYNESWSDWTAQNSKEYTNLSEGVYRFRVKARNVYGHESQEAKFSFSISPPWYRTLLAYFGYILFGFLMIITIVRLYTKKLEREKARLEKLVALRTEELKKSNEDLANANVDLAHANQELERLSLTDSLTLLPNRRNFELILSQEWKLSTRERQPLSMLMVDIDFFKSYNDTYGHPMGDDCLKKVAAAIHRCTSRCGDFVARLGGEEFGILLSNTPAAGASVMAERVRSSVEELQIPHQGSTINPVVTISVGTATIIPEKAFESDTLIGEADHALYIAKKQGRNRIFNSSL